MKILFIGGTGNISWHCVTQAQQAGHDIWVLNRAATVKTRRPCPLNVKRLLADIRDIDAVTKALNGLEFDVVADFICFTPEQARLDIELFKNITKQFIFISSAGVYQRPGSYPITEVTPLFNPGWDYAQNKIDCEKVFLEQYKKEDFPVTIVRPGHTYDTHIPDAVGNGDWTVAQRMIAGKPIVIHGDGSVLWTVTHAEDFARAFIELFGNSATIGEAYHITGDEWLTWRQISEMVAEALKVKNPHFVYIPSDIIAKANPELGQNLLGHKIWCDLYDNAKIKSVAKGWQAKIKFAEGIQRSLDWLKADSGRQRINHDLDLFLDNLCENYSSLTKHMEHER
jgi:nucleoside-diphosphate-sugar epimerase